MELRIQVTCSTSFGQEIGTLVTFPKSMIKLHLPFPVKHVNDLPHEGGVKAGSSTTSLNASFEYEAQKAFMMPPPKPMKTPENPQKFGLQFVRNVNKIIDPMNQVPVFFFKIAPKHALPVFPKELPFTLIT